MPVMNIQWVLALLGCMALSAPAQERVIGDFGGAFYSTQKIVHSTGSTSLTLPYAYFDYGRVYTRVDTVGVKTMRVGSGHLELAARISFEGFSSDAPGLHGIAARTNPMPLGVGTYQETPWGALFAYSFYDPSSGGSLHELTYAAEFQVGALSVYPQLGVEHRTQKYVQHLYGVSTQEALASGLGAYSATASDTPVLAMALEWPLDEAWHINVQWRRRWLDRAITQSPLVFAQRQDSGFLALTRSFK